MSAASVSWYSLTLARKSSKLILPLSSQATTTTLSPAIVALAGFVPCADAGIKQISRCPCPLTS